jgi:hypothetical protein
MGVKMHKPWSIVFVSALSIGTGSYLALAQPAEERHPMSFFVTSEAIGDGANLGGLEGADAHCQRLAEAAGAGGKTWPISARNPMTDSPQSMLGTASAMVPGTT